MSSKTIVDKLFEAPVHSDHTRVRSGLNKGLKMSDLGPDRGGPAVKREQHNPFMDGPMARGGRPGQGEPQTGEAAAKAWRPRVGKEVDDHARGIDINNTTDGGTLRNLISMVRQSNAGDFEKLLREMENMARETYESTKDGNDGGDPAWDNCRDCLRMAIEAVEGRMGD